MLNGDEAWKTLAACNGWDPDVFFPGEKNIHDVDHALTVCGVCPVRTECLDYALTNRIPFGIWGGATERQRRTILKQGRVTRRETATGYGRR